MFGLGRQSSENLHEHAGYLLKKGMCLAVIICVCNMMALLCAFCAGMKFAKIKHAMHEKGQVPQMPDFSFPEEEIEEEQS